MFARDVDLFIVPRPAFCSQPISELQTIASCFSEVLTYINEANGTDDCIQQMKFLTAGFVFSKVRQFYQTDS